MKSRIGAALFTRPAQLLQRIEIGVGSPADLGQIVLAHGPSLRAAVLCDDPRDTSETDALEGVLIALVALDH